MSDLSPFPASRYRLDFRVTRALALPAYAGSTLRGVFGAALRNNVCITGSATCDGCPLLTTCPYAIVFETRPTEEGHALQNFNQIPRPYVIEPPAWGERQYKIGEILSFNLVLVGRALPLLPLILQAFDKALWHSVGKTQGSAQLQRVTHCEVPETTILENQAGKVQPHQAQVVVPHVASHAVVLRFYTPLRLQSNGHHASEDEYTPRRLLMALIRRTTLLQEFHSSGRLSLDFHALAEKAGTLTSRKQLQWCDWSRYSSRQQQKVMMGGMMGDWGLEGDLAPFLPFLHLGQWLHVGKEATFGMGGYRLEVAA